MQTAKFFQTVSLLLCITGFVSACGDNSSDTNNAANPGPEQMQPEIAIDDDDIAGVVTSRNGPEAGVWVIAETDAFNTRYAKIVSTDDQGRFVIPDLPRETFRVWVRGYGLIDSDKLDATPGNIIKLQAEIAPDKATDARNYPAAYWYAMMRLPQQEELTHLPGGLNQYLFWMKNRSCIGCHQLGNLATRTLPEGYGVNESTEIAWSRRISSGQAGMDMVKDISNVGAVAFKYLADWTDRIAAGELPTSAPERPAGIERNVVYTVRDWSNPQHYMHDLTGTDRRNPTVNGYGRFYGSPEFSTDEIPILDPVNNVVSHYLAPVRDEDTPTTADDPVVAPSPYWGNEVIWNSKAFIHNPMLDHKGRVWLTTRIRAANNPDFCKAGSEHPSAKLFPVTTAGRHLAVYEPDTGKYTFVDTCFGTHHLQFAEDEDNTLWTSGGGPVVGWVNTRIFDETGSAEAAVGWSPFILDTNGNGVRDKWVEPDQPIDPTLDKRTNAGFYAVMVNPADGTIWGTRFAAYPGTVVRYDPRTGLGEAFNVPLPGFGIRGADIDRNGVIWASLGSGHLGEFDRRKCTGPLNGPEATGDHCPEGWTFHDLPGPGFVDLPDKSVESSYWTWVDQHDTLGLGPNVPIVSGNLHDGVHAFVDGKFVTISLPYPLSFYIKGMEGRIDDPNAGWKGRGLWATSGNRTPWHVEGGKGTRPLVVHFQVRPDPLAK